MVGEVFLALILGVTAVALFGIFMGTTNGGEKLRRVNRRALEQKLDELRQQLGGVQSSVDDPREMLADVTLDMDRMSKRLDENRTRRLSSGEGNDE
ncbi:MAG: hypothetical protein O3A46_09435 [Candidatus Poribacteria bacterium]|nr:hypothetical protein [Candidatus Poribacteria bacterium]